MEINKIVNLIHTIDDLDGLYLLCPLTTDAGFFSNDGKLLFVARDMDLHPTTGVETDYLQLQTHIRVSAVKNNQTFKDDFYNIILFKGPINDDGNASSFVNLCEIYSKNLGELDFKEFFYSLIDLFQLPSEQSYKNAVGLYGELKLMQHVQAQYSIDMSTVWHKSGSFSRYDFSGTDSCIEVKTTSSEDSCVSIKHKQIFDGKPCYLAVICCDVYDGGETIAELINLMMKKTDSFQNFNFSLNIAKELKKVSPRDIQELKFSTNSIQFYDAREINPFSDLPDNISELKYRLDVSDCTNIKSTELVGVLEKFV